jgi:hypothetical protein
MAITKLLILLDSHARGPVLVGAALLRIVTKPAYGLSLAGLLTPKSLQIVLKIRGPTAFQAY